MTRIGIAAPNAASADAALTVASHRWRRRRCSRAAMLTAMVNEPGIVSLTGGAFITIWPAGTDRAVTVDGCVAMPGRGRTADAPPPDVREVTTDYGGGLTMTVGHGSVATPGALAALDLAHHRYGRVPWRDVVAPAEVIARQGFPLGTAAGYYLNHTRDSVFAWDPETSAALRRDDGTWVEPGDTMVIDGLAETFAHIAEHGASTMYDGDLAARDRRRHRQQGRPAHRRRPVRLPTRRTGDTRVQTAGDWQLRTNPPPAFGGAVLTAMLTLLGDRPARRVDRRRRRPSHRHPAPRPRLPARAPRRRHRPRARGPRPPATRSVSPSAAPPAPRTSPSSTRPARPARSRHPAATAPARPFRAPACG